MIFSSMVVVVGRVSMLYSVFFNLIFSLNTSGDKNTIIARLGEGLDFNMSLVSVRGQ